jgi:MFS family permease
MGEWFMRTRRTMSAPTLQRRAYRLIILLGLVSLFGDISYEGVRGVTGPYLALLGASAVAVGLVAGLGEFAGYALRTASGYLADRLRLHWLLTVVGYGLIATLPLLALVHRWELAAALIVLERLGKALRTPSRDAILSHAASQVGRGKGFGIHEALDQLGALIGPVIFAVALTFDGEAGYRLGFGLLTIPAILAIVILVLAWRQEPEPESLESVTPRVNRPTEASGSRRLSGPFWRYTLFTALTTLGFVPFALLSYHVEQTGRFSPPLIPLLYAVAMGVDGGIALIAGWGYDRFGLRTLAAVPVCIALGTAAALQSTTGFIITGVVVWGIAMGLVETTMRAAVGELSAPSARGLAYGVFNTVFGTAWLAGGAVLGYLYEQLGSRGTIGATLVLEIAALLLFWGLGVARAHASSRAQSVS